MRIQKCRRIQKHSLSPILHAHTEMSAHTKVHAHTILLFGLGGLSTLLSFTARLKFSFLFSFSPSEGVAPPPSGPQVGSVHKSAQLIWAACLPYWHGWWYWHAMTKTCQNVGTLGEMSAPYAECRRPPTFWPFLQEKVKKLTLLKSVLSLPFKFVQTHKSRPISAMPLLGL